VGHSDAGLDAELVRLSGFAFANAFRFGRMQGVELVLVFRLLGTDPLSPFEQRV
jgi:hypothetical protein